MQGGGACAALYGSRRGGGTCVALCGSRRGGGACAALCGRYISDLAGFPHITTLSANLLLPSTNSPTCRVYFIRAFTTAYFQMHDE